MVMKSKVLERVKPLHSIIPVLTLLLLLLGVGQKAFSQAGFFGTGGGLISINQNNLGIEHTYNIDGRNLGETRALILDGGYIHTYKGSNGNICGGNLHYRVYKNGATPGSFTAITMNFSANAPFTTTATPSNVGGNNGGDQRWANSGQNIDLLSGLTDYGSTYVLEVYFDASGSSSSSSGCSETFYYSNAGSNYKMSFVLTRASKADGNWHSASTWIGNSVPAANEKVLVLHNVDIDQVTTNTGGIAIASGKTLDILTGDSLLLGNGITGSGSVDVNGTLVIQSGGYSLISPTYNSGSSLVYASGGSYNRGNEWSSSDPHHLVIANSTTFNLGHAATASARAVGGDLRVESGSKLDLNNPAMSGKLSVSGDITNLGTITLSTTFGGDLEVQGDLSNQGVFESNSREVVLNGTATQAVSGTWDASGSNNHFDYLRISNTASPALRVDNDVRIQNRLQMDGGNVVLRTSDLSIDAGGSIQGTFGASNMIVTDSTGLLKQGISSTGTYVLPIGRSHYSPLTLDYNSGAINLIQARVVDRKLPGNRSLSNFLKRYWEVEANGNSNLNADMYLNYDNSDVNGIEDSLYGGRNINDTVWYRYPKANVSGNFLTFKSIGDFGIFTAGERDSMSSFYPAKITKQPTGVRSCTGYQAFIFIEKTGTIDSLKWQVNNGAGWMDHSIKNKDSLHFDSLIASDGGQYRAIAYAFMGNDTSNVVTVALSQKPNVQVLSTPAGGGNSGALDVQSSVSAFRFARWSSESGVNHPLPDALDRTNLPAGTYYLMCVSEAGCLYYFGPYDL